MGSGMSDNLIMACGTAKENKFGKTLRCTKVTGWTTVPTAEED